jgi:hypothetical protein
VKTESHDERKTLLTHGESSACFALEATLGNERAKKIIEKGSPEELEVKSRAANKSGSSEDTNDRHGISEQKCSKSGARNRSVYCVLAWALMLTQNR